jgi:membrane-bound ClpP family serine protease
VIGGQVGRAGVAVTPLAPHGVVRVDAEEWSATVDGRSVAPGEPIDVLGRRGLRLRVRAADERVCPATAKAERWWRHGGHAIWAR